MPYTRTIWRNRHAERSDLSTRLTHLAKPGTADGAQTFDATLDILLKILTERRLIGSSTDSGFICGNVRAVCFQDAPLSAIVQNLWFEQKYRETNPATKKLRYTSIGLMFPKPYVFRKGGRPVVYDRTGEAKKYLPEDEWWRIVSFDLSDDEAFVDWTHEREWRLPGDFEFDLAEVIITLTKDIDYRLFVKRCKAITEVDILAEIQGIVTTSAVLF